MKKPFINKKSFKQRHGKCQICGEERYKLLDIHRFKKEGKDGGRYSEANCICCCVKCHRLIHTGEIKIIGVHNSTIGKLLNYIDEEGKEHFK